MRNGKKALLACAQDSLSEYSRDGTLPSGRTLDDYHKFIRQSMFVQLNGAGRASGDNKGDNDANLVSEKEKNDGEEKENDDDNGFMPVEADNMLEDYIFPGMIAFFLWGFIIDDSSGNQGKYRSKQYQLDDSSPVQKGSKGRRQARKEARSIASREQDVGAAVGSPFKRGITLNQQIEIAKLQAATGIEERK